MKAFAQIDPQSRDRLCRPSKPSRNLQLVRRAFSITALALLCALKPVQVRAQYPPHFDQSNSMSAGASSMEGYSGPAQSRTGQAVLHITCTVMPIIVAPQVVAENSGTRNYLVYLPSLPPDVDVISESHPLQEKGGATLKTTTIVLR